MRTLAEWWTMNGTEALAAVLLVVIVAMSVGYALALRRIRQLEAFWQVVGVITDAELLALNSFREAARKIQAHAESDARIEAKRKHRAQQHDAPMIPEPPKKKGRSADAL